MVEGVVCSFKIATTLARDRVSPWPLLASLLYQPLALGGDRSTSPLLRLLNMGIKDTLGSLLLICLLGTIAGRYYLPPGKRALVITLSFVSPTCPKL